MPDRIEVATRQNIKDAAGESVRNRIAEDLHIHLSKVHVIDVYTLNADLNPEELERVRVELFTDPVTQTSTVNSSIASEYDYLLEVGFRPGVTDNVGRSALEGIQDTLGRQLKPGEAVYKSTQYALSGITHADAKRIAREALANELIEQWVLQSQEEMQSRNCPFLLELPIVQSGSRQTKSNNVLPDVQVIRLDLDDAALMQLSRDMVLALDLREMKAIQAYYNRPDVVDIRKKTGLPSQPTDIELEILAQTWSEHCKHKIFAAHITYTEPDGSVSEIDGLFKNYVKATTEAVAGDIDWLVSVFHDNAGIIRFDEDYHFALKAETHNSPSALDPYGGAMTGIVGVNRDILGAGMGCRCIFNTDVFCFASPYYDKEIPERLLHPRRVLRGVHRGVMDGGNESGIPTVNGAIVFHDRFLGKPLVFCGTGGLIPVEVAGRPSHEKAACPGDLIVMAGGRIGKDGIHGATFSSEELHEGSPATAVQIGDPITQKKLSDFLLEARDLGLFRAVTDNGAGGLSSSIGEMARDPGGAEVHLDKAPLKYQGLAPWEIFLSEAQERMTFAVKPDKINAFKELASRRAVEVSVIGSFNASGTLSTFYEGRCIGSLLMEFLHDGVPRMQLQAQLNTDPEEPEIIPEEPDLTGALKEVLGMLNVASKEALVRMYDHEVQGNSVLKPFQGVLHDGPGDAAVLTPVSGSKRGIAVANGICPKYSDIDTYSMMACAVDEAVRNLISVGAQMGTIAGLDNFCWPDPVESERTPDGKHKLAQLVRCCQALYDTCVAYSIPLISGKDSMKNDYNIGDTRISIPPTVLFSAAAILDDVTHCVTMDVKNVGDRVYVLGDTRHELGGSEYLALRGQLGSTVPQVEPTAFRKRYERLAYTIQQGWVASCHDCSDGGLGVALAESAFAGMLGMELELQPVFPASPVVALFSESQGRFVISVPERHAESFEATFQEDSLYRLGTVTKTPVLKICWADKVIVQADLEELKTAWKKPLDL